MHSDNSLLAPPIEDINDNGKLYSNVGHNSRAFDGIKLGGVRMNYGVICSSNYERCKTDNNGKLLRNDKGNIVYIGNQENNKYLKVSSLLADKNESGKLFGATGGFQAIKGTMFGLEYKPGSFLDKVTETYSGQHDLVGGQLFFYDKYGNGRRDLTPQQEQYVDYFSIGAVGAVTPTTVPHTLPIEVMNLLFGVR